MRYTKSLTPSPTVAKSDNRVAYDLYCKQSVSDQKYVGNTFSRSTCESNNAIPIVAPFHGFLLLPGLDKVTKEATTMPPLESSKSTVLLSVYVP